MAAAALLAAGATSGVQVSASQLAEFHKGEATYEQVVAKLGPPTYSTVDSEGARTISYIYAKTKIKGASFVPVVGLFAGGMKIDSSTASFVFEPSGILKEWYSTGSQMDTSNGAAKAPKP